MNEINRSCIFNILHVCDYHYGYDDLSPFLDYPGHIVNCSLTVGTEKLTGAQISQMFNRPFMGGLDRKGVVATGNAAEIKQTVEGVLREAPDKFILAADCTLPNDVNWDNIKAAIDVAHQYKTKN
jgi:uroporphyrinogen decarboxylase